jgi:SAM-dependent methyltransferase
VGDRVPVHPPAFVAYYDELYEGRYMDEHSRVERMRVRDVLSSIPVRGVRSILDYGCGRGAWISLLRDVFPSAVVTGSEISETALLSAAGAFPNLTFLHFDGKRVPRGDRTFDLVFSYHVLEHVMSLSETVADIARLTKRWACVCLPCRNEGSFEERMARESGGLEVSSTGESRFRHDEEGHLRRPATEELVAEFAKHGFCVRRAWFSGHHWGALEFLVESGPHVINAVVPPSRWGLRMTLKGGYAVHRVDRAARWPRQGESVARRSARAGLLVLNPATSMLLAPIRVASKAEWRRRRSSPSGSAQYLIFERAIRDPELQARLL